MIPLHQILSRFKGLTNTEKIKKQQIAAIISTYNIPIGTKQIVLNKKIIQLTTAPIIKTEIFLKKEKILAHINRELGEDSFLNIQ